MNPVSPGGGTPGKGDINPSTGKAYAVNPSTGQWDDNYWANTVEPQLKAAAGPQTPNLQNIYDTAYTNNPAVQASQQKITGLQGQITTRQQARDTALKDVNDNPFYSEATRVGHVARVNQEAENDINTVNGQLTTEQTNLSNLQGEAQRQVNLATGQYDINRQQYQDSLSRFNMLLSSGAFTSASPSDLATISAQTGISPSMLQSIQTTQKQKDVAPQIVTAQDNEGNLTITAVDKNTGKIINTDTLAGVGKAKGGNGKTPNPDSPAQITKDTNAQFLSDAGTIQPKKANGVSVGQYPQLVAKYAGVLSLQDINKLYMDSSLGKTYGKPTESANFINNLYTASKKGVPAPKQTIQ